MSALKGSRTEKNLLAAFAGKCQACVRYAFHAKKARKEGFEQIAALFEETSHQERAHASRMYKLMGGLEDEVAMPLAGASGSSTLENLERAATDEAREALEACPARAAVAREEGFAEAALMFAAMAVAEAGHMERFRQLAGNVREGRVFSRPEPVTWRCRHCGWSTLGRDAPERCPACAHARAHFEVSASNW